MSSTLQQGPSNSLGSTQPTQQTPLDVILIIFIHGFKGDDTTFGDFPSRLQHILSETVQGAVIESVLFPSYDTKAISYVPVVPLSWVVMTLVQNKAVERFADWLTTLTVQKEVAHSLGGGTSRAKIVLCGHSMGGLLAADSLDAFINTRPDINAPLWPNIIACLAFDTPYLGLNPNLFKDSANKAADMCRMCIKLPLDSGALSASQDACDPGCSTCRVASSSGSGIVTRTWGSWGPAAYATSKRLGALTEHMQYVGALWDKDALAARVRYLVEGETKHGVIFRTFYTLIPPSPPANLPPRTFCILPEPSSDAFQRFVPRPIRC
ncbi:hypothetical protein BJV77DRAFT_1063979 [Russula vinacea]|nr:hypothetical protein BJV77DRAFT_1063979 [Russula vinacea]